MDSLIVRNIDRQIVGLQQVLVVFNDIKEKCLKLEREKNDAVEKYNEVMAKLERLSKRKCNNCVILTKKLIKERKERAKMKKEEKTKLLKMIAKTLENIEDVNTNQLTNAQQFFTQLIYDATESPGEKTNKNFALIEDTDNSEETSDTKVLANDTVIVIESEGSCNELGPPVLVPETEIVNLPVHIKQEPLREKSNTIENHLVVNEKRVSTEKEVEIQPLKKVKCSPVLSKMIAKDGLPPSLHSIRPDTVQIVVKEEGDRSPSVLSEIIEAMDDSSNTRASVVKNDLEEKGISWKMKPSVLIENQVDAANGKKLKQMTLSLTRSRKKHDISLSEGFNGGVFDINKMKNDEEKDVILPSPEHSSRKTLCKKTDPVGTMEDPDLTVFHPPITSTCHQLDNSFDRLPELKKSPPYKYRRETIRKREERLKLPGQACGNCAKFYEAAGLDKTQELRSRMNACSRHRDKYDIRAHTPPGFWDPVLPNTPEDES